MIMFRGCWNILPKVYCWMLEYFTLGYCWMPEYFDPGILLDAGIFHPRDTTGWWNILPHGIILNAGRFHPRGTTVCWNVLPQG